MPLSNLTNEWGNGIALLSQVQHQLSTAEDRALYSVQFLIYVAAVIRAIVLGTKLMINA